MMSLIFQSVIKDRNKGGTKHNNLTAKVQRTMFFFSDGRENAMYIL